MYPHLRLCLHLTLCARFTLRRALLNFDLSVCVILVLCVRARHFPFQLPLSLSRACGVLLSLCLWVCVHGYGCVHVCESCLSRAWSGLVPILPIIILDSSSVGLSLHLSTGCLVNSQPGSVCLSCLSPSPFLIPDLSLCTCCLHTPTALCKDTPISSCTLEPPHPILSLDP